MFRGFRQALRCRYPTRKSVRYFGLSNVRQNALKSQALPLPPAVSDEPLVESDFEQYLFPLYQNGWGMSFTTAVATKRTEIPVTALHRVLHFSSNKDVESFLSSTYDLCAQEKIFPNAILAFGHRLRLFATSPVGLTHSSIRAALLCETNYQKVVRSGAVFPFMNPVFKVGSITEASHLAAARLAEVRLAGDRYIPPPPCIPALPDALPAPPPPPALPPPSITQSDLSTYLRPLATHGWYVRSSARHPRGDPSKIFLCRVFSFTDAEAAWAFFALVVAMRPIYKSADPFLELNATPVGADVKVRRTSRLRAGERRQWGISHEDICFALALQTELERRFAASTLSIVRADVRPPMTMEELWNPDMLDVKPSE